jgi:valine--pyruvate aminotransferase
MLAGEFEDGSAKKILLPLCPEYIGYADQGLDPKFFTSNKPKFEFIDDHTFKYHIDFDALEVTDDVAAICVSRPTNPSANVLTNEEITRLSDLAKAHDIPLIIDNAYGAPFPGIIFKDVEPFFDQHLIVSLSLSKLGLPGTRTGIVIANEGVVAALSSINAVVSLANGNIGQEIVAPLLVDDRIIDLSQNVIRPYYESKAKQGVAWLKEFLDDSLPYYIHASEGAMFLWLWCKDLPITAKELYERLKARGVIVVPGHYFFFGNDDEWSHRDECIRINHSQPDEVVKAGLQIIAEEVTAAYAAAGE